MPLNKQATSQMAQANISKASQIKATARLLAEARLPINNIGQQMVGPSIKDKFLHMTHDNNTWHAHDTHETHARHAATHGTPDTRAWLFTDVPTAHGARHTHARIK